MFKNRPKLKILFGTLFGSLFVFGALTLTYRFIAKQDLNQLCVIYKEALARQKTSANRSKIIKDLYSQVNKQLTLPASKSIHNSITYEPKIEKYKKIQSRFFRTYKIKDWECKAFIAFYQ